MVGISIFHLNEIMLSLHPGKQTVCAMYNERALSVYKGNHTKGGTRFVIILENFVIMLLINRDTLNIMHLVVEVLFLSSNSKINGGQLMPEMRTVHLVT